LGIYFIQRQNVDEIEARRIWDGILSIRNGFYKGGKFKLSVYFEEDFPKNPP